jgi:RNHCP domain-containing protein
LARTDENTGFRCARCAAPVPPLSNGSYRNHCPVCLWSQHVDDARPGDRASTCRGAMRPIAIARAKKGWQIVHRCERCGVERKNRVAEGTVVPDDIDAIVALFDRRD